MDENDALCPICGSDYYEKRYDVCDHLLSDWDYCEAEGIWAGDQELLRQLRAASEELIEAFQDTKLKKGNIVKLAPPHLAPLVKECLAKLYFPCGTANEYVGSLIRKSQHYAGETFCESCSPAGSAWRTYWSSNPTECAAEIETQLSADIESLRAIHRKIKETPK
jgi:hypothetical protein